MTLIILKWDEGTGTMLMKCRNCGADYSEYAGCCPKCGNKNAHIRKLEKDCYNITNRQKYFTYDPSEKVKKERDVYRIFQICAIVMVIIIVILGLSYL